MRQIPYPHFHFIDYNGHAPRVVFFSIFQCHAELLSFCRRFQVSCTVFGTAVPKRRPSALRFGDVRNRTFAQRFSSLIMIPSKLLMYFVLLSAEPYEKS